MSFSAFALFFCIALWLIFGQKWLTAMIESKKEMGGFCQTSYKLRYALPLLIYVIIELVARLYNGL